MSIVRTSGRSLMGFLVAALMLAGMAAIPATAQEKSKAAKAEKGKVTQSVRAENEKLRAFETRYKPGDVNVGVPTSSFRVIRVLKGGTLLWTYADGKTEKKVWKAGDVILLEPGPAFTTKNVGKSEMWLYVVAVK